MSNADLLSDSTLHKMRNGSFDRYIYVKGSNLVSPISKLKGYAELAAPQSPRVYQFEFVSNDEWTIFKLPSSTSHWMFLNITYWFLGWGNEDPNYADDVIGLAVAKNPSSASHVVYVSNEYPKPRDSMYGAMKNGVFYTINVPFDELTVGPVASVPSIDGILQKIEFNAPKLEEVEKQDVTFYGGLEQKVP